MLTVADVRAALRIEHNEEDALLARLIRAARAYLERRTGRYLGEPELRTEYLWGVGTTELWLSDPPQATGDPATVVVAVTERLGSADPSTVDVEAYRIQGRRLVGVGRYWLPGREYAVTYTAGYEDDEGPADVLQDAYRLVAYWYEHREVAGKDVPADFEAGLASERATYV